MINATDFVHNLNSDNISSIVTRFFDEIMVLYNLVGYRQDLDICTDDSASLATFIILMDSEADAEDLYNKFNGYGFSVYRDTYLISMNISGSSVRTTIEKAVS